MSKRGPDELDELQDESQWDFELAERQRAPRGSRAVVSVAFKSHDFALVTAAAREAGQPTSQFIRQAAVAAASGRRVDAAPGVIVVEGRIGSAKDFPEAIRRLVIGEFPGPRAFNRAQAVPTPSTPPG